MKTNMSETIRLIRESKGYSQEFMASRLHVTQQAYSKMEKQPDTMTLKRLKDLAHILDVPLISLLGEENMYFMQNINQQGGQAATKLIFQNQVASMEHSELIKSMHEEIEFLRSLVVKLQEGK
jgi:transcriptional regulator with XRE-family HTH domain